MRCRQKGFRPRDWPWQPASPRRLAAPGDFSSSPHMGWSTSMPNDQDLFSEEQSMVDDELRRAHRRTARPADPGPHRLIRRRGRRFHPAAGYWLAGDEKDGRAGEARPSTCFTAKNTTKKPSKPRWRKRSRRSFRPWSMPSTFVTELKKVAPKLDLPDGESLQGQKLNLPVQFFCVRNDRRRPAFHGSDRPEPGVAGPARDADDFLHGLPGHGPGAGESLGFLPDLGVCGRGVVPARAEVREKIPPVLAGPLPWRSVPLLLCSFCPSP